MLGLVFGIIGAIVGLVWRTINREERQRLEKERLERERNSPEVPEVPEEKKGDDSKS